MWSPTQSLIDDGQLCCEKDSSLCCMFGSTHTNILLYCCVRVSEWSENKRRITCKSDMMMMWCILYWCCCRQTTIQLGRDIVIAALLFIHTYIYCFADQTQNLRKKTHLQWKDGASITYCVWLEETFISFGDIMSGDDLVFLSQNNERICFSRMIGRNINRSLQTANDSQPHT